MGLTSITVGIETPDDAKLSHYRRAPIEADRQREFIATCRGLGIRTVAGFLIGFPGDTEESIRRVRDYALLVNPTFANFNVVTPYPGTAFFEAMRERIGDVRLQPLHGLHAGAEVRASHAASESSTGWRSASTGSTSAGNTSATTRTCSGRASQRLGIGKGPPAARAEAGHAGVPRPLSGLEILDRKGLRPDGPHCRGRAAERRE